MPQPIDVGSILGGRYKVTGRILASAENDVILDGLDQVLNRPVSILVASVDNSEHLTQSAREVATGARISNVSILDLGVQDSSAYLIAARTTPADLLDLVVPTEPVEETYQEPFFTDTLGTEIFGAARDAAPTASGYVYEDNSPLTPAHPLPRVHREPDPTPPPAAAVGRPTQPGDAVVPPAAAKGPASKVTVWDDSDFGFMNDDAGQPANSGTNRPGVFPTELRAASDGYEEDYYDDEEDDERNTPRISGRWLTGAIVSVLLIIALVFAVQHIAGLLNGSNQAGGNTSAAPSDETSSNSTGTPSSQAPVEPAPVLPVIKGLTDVTTYADGVPNYGETYFPRLPDAIDGNKATYWPTVEFSSADFAGMTEGINLAVELEADSNISSVTITQLNGTGGQFNILTNDKPSVDGATKIGNGSFSAPDLTIPAAPGAKGKYVIINFTQLPNLAPFTQYPYGLKIAEISIK
ncbi:hypothetical protein JOF48_001511 [Arthrobacter stackebrandtii]|uniref:ABC transporter substrate-binding protein n=1 Tax=Arthrobacter stackebrandtii TaxID=272161 RepID=A0ABS4YV85_9MICC|nr:ABC transporter substrate-binding protein [Arthrobacter stackebrandtii]MBP2412712.1 hypothetical protein [Arthrobacter stackebrandtii]